MASRNSAGIMREDALDYTVNIYEKVNDYIKGIGLIAGSLLATIADWLLGGFTFSILFSGASTLLPKYATPGVLGFILSGALWGIQLIMWQIVLSGVVGEFFPNKRGQKWVYAGLFLAMGIFKLADDGIDMTFIYWLAQHNPFIGALPTFIYNILIWCVALVSWGLVGFSEAFVSLSMLLLRRGVRNERRVVQPPQSHTVRTPRVTTYPSPAPRVANYPEGFKQNQERLAQAMKAAGAAAVAPEPSYHPRQPMIEYGATTPLATLEE